MNQIMMGTTSTNQKQKVLKIWQRKMNQGELGSFGHDRQSTDLMRGGSERQAVGPAVPKRWYMVSSEK